MSELLPLQLKSYGYGAMAYRLEEPALDPLAQGIGVKSNLNLEYAWCT